MQYPRRPSAVGILVTLGFISACAMPVTAATLTVEVVDSRGAPLRQALVALHGGSVPAAESRVHVMDQANRQFAPRVMAISRGDSVHFPNSDNVRHNVYSFSRTKPFQLPLYGAEASEPVQFEKAGIVVLGCNIHDQMSAVIHVVDTPYFAIAADGQASIPDLPAGDYRVSVRASGSRGAAAPEQTVTLDQTSVVALSFVVPAVGDTGGASDGKERSSLQKRWDALRRAKP